MILNDQSTFLSFFLASRFDQNSTSTALDTVALLKKKQLNDTSTVVTSVSISQRPGAIPAAMKSCSSLAKSQLLTVLFFVAAGCCLAQAQSPAAESLSVIATNDFTCRMEPQLDYCGLPLYLANFQVISGVGTASCSFPPDHNVWLTSIFNLFYFNHTGQPQMRRWCQNWPSCKR